MAGSRDLMNAAHFALRCAGVRLGLPMAFTSPSAAPSPPRPSERDLGVAAAEEFDDAEAAAALGVIGVGVAGAGAEGVGAAGAVAAVQVES